MMCLLSMRLETSGRTMLCILYLSLRNTSATEDLAVRGDMASAVARNYEL